MSGDYGLFQEEEFQSTRPVKDATKRSSHTCLVLKVSIHASREGRDSVSVSPSMERVKVGSFANGHIYLLQITQQLFGISANPSPA